MLEVALEGRDGRVRSAGRAPGAARAGPGTAGRAAAAISRPASAGAGMLTRPAQRPREWYGSEEEGRQGRGEGGQRLRNARKANPYIQRIVEDAELRDNVREAYESARKAYGRLSNGKAPTKALLEDKKLQKDLPTPPSLAARREHRLRQGKKRKGAARLGKLLVLALVGAASRSP